MTGYKREELIGKSFLKLKLLSLADIPKAAKLLVKNLRGQPTGADEFVLNRKDNSKVTVEISTYPVKIKGKTLVLGIARDVTERKKSEERIKHLNLVLHAIRNVNQLIIREKNREKLLKNACENLIKARGYYNTWIALLNKEGKLKTCTEAGLGKDFLPMIELFKKGKLTACCQKALKQQEVVITEDPVSTCTECPLAQKYSGRGAMTTRLEHNGKVYGLMSVSIPAHLAVDQEEQSLFEELAEDIAFCLYNIELDEERKQSTEALRTSEERYFNLFDNANDLIQVVNPAGKMLAVNKKWLATLEYSPEDVKSLRVTDILREDKIPQISGSLQAVAGGRSVSFETVFISKSGKEINVEGSGNGIFKDGKLVSAVGIFRDITERKQSEMAIIYEQSLLHALMDNISDTVYFKDKEKRFIRVNKVKAEHSEVTPEEMIGKTDFDFFPPEIAKQSSADDDLVIKSAKPIIDKVEKIIYSDKTEHWVSTTKVPWYNSEGKIIGTIGITRDITERKQAEERIKHLDLVIHAIRNVNQLIVQEKDRERLLKRSCDSLIKTRGYYHSRVVLLDKERKINIYTEAGLGEDFLPLVKLLKKGELSPCGQIALKQEDVVVIEDPASACPDCPLVQACSDRESVMTCRLEHGGKVYGVMSVSIPIHFIADKEEHALFKEVAGDIALGLHSIELGKKLDKQTHDLQQSYQRTKRAMDATIETMSKIVEAKDPYTAGHQQKVSQLATAIAGELNFSKDKIEGIRIASLIHDIGKIGLPTEILSKPIKLSDIEFSLIKEHSQIGHDILKSIDFSYPVASIVLQHHERLDGSGYPNNLKGDKIFLEAKIIGIADVVEAMSSHRPYRPALGIDKALEEISQNRGILYEPKVVDVCLKLFKEKEFKFK